MTTAAAQPHARFTPGLVEFLKGESAQLKKDKETTNYPCYQAHFEKTKAAINDAFKGLNTTSALILGVGAAQDIDLKALAMAFDTVRLVDIDLSQTKKALAEQVPEENLRAKFELETADLTGIFPELCTTVEKLAGKKDLTYNAFVEKILDLLPTLKPTTFPYKQTKSSFVCSSLIGTQLIGTLVNYLNTSTQKRYGRIFAPPQNREAEFNSFLTSINEAHLTELRVLVSPSGRIYYADHFTAKGLARISHPENPEITDVVQVLGEGGFPFTKSLAAVVQKVFTVVSQQKWGWALPIGTSMQTAEMTNDDGTIQTIPIKVTEFREYQVSSYVLKQSEVSEGKG